MDSPTSFRSRLTRIYHAAEVERDADLARVLGITPQSISSAKNKQKIPGGWVEKISGKFGVSADWLLHARGPMKAEHFNNLRSGDFSCEMALFGLPCDDPAGWTAASILSENTTVPGLSRDAFSVLVSGSGMVPAGILPGQVLYCDPAVHPVHGEAAYVVRNGKSGEEAGLRILKDMREDELIFEAWKENKPGAFEPYSVRQALEDVTLIAPVILVRRRL